MPCSLQGSLFFLKHPSENAFQYMSISVSTLRMYDVDARKLKHNYERSIDIKDTKLSCNQSLRRTAQHG